MNSILWSRYRKPWIMLVILALTFTAGCSRKDGPQSVDLEKREVTRPAEKPSHGKSLRIAIGGMITPKEGFTYYRKFLDYVSEKLHMDVVLVDRESYAEVNNLLRTGAVDIAFVCGGPYVDGHKEFGMELLVAPVAYGEAAYYSYIIVAKDSPIYRFEELRGKKFAFTDPMSNSGKLVPTYMLARINETPDTFFKSYIFTQSHDKAIKTVALGIVDGAAVDSLIWEYENGKNPEFTSMTRIVKRSPPYGIPPVVVRPGLDPELKETLKTIFLNAHNDRKGRELLSNMKIDKFISVSDEAYDSIREMKVWIEGRKLEKIQGR
jgi:phosphonate transport system substrate-binding protein